MATTVTKTSGTSVKLYNPKYIFIRPFTDANTPGDIYYQCEDIIEDTTVIAQNENTENKVNNELSSSPIINNIKAGEYTVATEIGDVQPELLKAVLGYDVSTDKKKAYAPSGYVAKFAEFILVFPLEGATDKWIACTLPKIQMNPTLTVDSLSTSLGRIVLAGTGQLMTVGTGAEAKTTPFYVDFDYTLPVSGGS